MFWFNFAGSILVPESTLLDYVGEDDSKLDDKITIGEYMNLSEDEKKSWSIVDPYDIEDYEEIVYDLEKCSLEPFEEEQQGL